MWSGMMWALLAAASAAECPEGYHSYNATTGNCVLCNATIVVEYDGLGPIVHWNAYMGGVYHPVLDRIYFAPYGQAPSTTWHYLNGTNGEVEAHIHGVTAVANAYAHGAYAPSLKRVYWVPMDQRNEPIWHYIDVEGVVVGYFHNVSVAEEGFSYSGAVYHDSLDRIYFVPHGNGRRETWHYLDGQTGVIVGYSHNFDIVHSMAYNSYRGGAYAPYLERVYFAPYGQAVKSLWHYANGSGIVEGYVHGTSGLSNTAYDDATYVPILNRIYFIPFGSSQATFWHYVDGATGNVVAYLHGTTINIFSAYIGGVYDPSLDRLYFVPWQQSQEDTWHYVDYVDGVSGEVVAYEHGHDVGWKGYSGGVYAPNLHRVYFIPQAQGNDGDYHYVMGVTDSVAQECGINHTESTTTSSTTAAYAVSTVGDELRVALYGDVTADFDWDTLRGGTTPSKLRISGGESKFSWINFVFDSNYVSGLDVVYFENIVFDTSSLNGYCVRSRSTGPLVYMENVTISGYSGRAGETAGGAVRIQAQTYPDLDLAMPAFKNVRVEHCCRGIRIEDTMNFGAVNCHVENVTDNALYFAASTYATDSGCQNSVFLGCTVVNAGQAGIQIIGGDNISVVDTTIEHSRGAGASLYNVNGSVTLDRVTFVDANTAHVTTPYGGNTDDFNGATVGASCSPSSCVMQVDIKATVFYGGGVLSEKTLVDSGGTSSAETFASPSGWTETTVDAVDSIVTHISTANVAISFVGASLYDHLFYVDQPCSNGTGGVSCDFVAGISSTRIADDATLAERALRVEFNGTLYSLTFQERQRIKEEIDGDVIVASGNLLVYGRDFTSVLLDSAPTNQPSRRRREETADTDTGVYIATITNETVPDETVDATGQALENSGSVGGYGIQSVTHVNSGGSPTPFSTATTTATSTVGEPSGEGETDLIIGLSAGVGGAVLIFTIVMVVAAYRRRKTQYVSFTAFM